jgi:hypothetical protein
MHKKTEKLKRSCEAPKPTFQGAPSVLSVQLTEDENVRWVWTHTIMGSYVSGYTIVKKKPSIGKNRIGQL